MKKLEKGILGCILVLFVMAIAVGYLYYIETVPSVIKDLVNDHAEISSSRFTQSVNATEQAVPYRSSTGSSLPPVIKIETERTNPSSVVNYSEVVVNADVQEPGKEMVSTTLMSSKTEEADTETTQVVKGFKSSNLTSSQHSRAVTD